MEELKSDIKSQVGEFMIDDLAAIVTGYIPIDDWYAGYYGIQTDSENPKTIDYLMGALESQNPPNIRLATKPYQSIKRLDHVVDIDPIIVFLRPLVKSMPSDIVYGMFNISRYLCRKNGDQLCCMLIDEIIKYNKVDVDPGVVDNVVRHAASAGNLEFCKNALDVQTHEYAKTVIISGIEVGAIRGNQQDIIEWLLDNTSRPSTILDEGIYQKSEMAIRMAIQRDPSLYQGDVRAEYPNLLEG